MSICHLIFTRFNIQYEQDDSIGIQPKWLNDRLRLFEQFCIPSIKAQTCQDFIWLILGDERTPEDFKKRIDNYSLSIPEIRVHWVAFQNDAYLSFYKHLGEKYAAGKDVVISTRLDNDDALSEQYVKRIQELAKQRITGIISFPFGKQTFTKNHTSYNIIYKQNHFTSCIETSEIKTIMAYDHTLVPLDSLYLVETEKPMWEEIVHGKNIANSYKPEYIYFTNGFVDKWHLLWHRFNFQMNRLLRFCRTHLVLSHKK